ncbi:MAG TPA: hypothetical protein VMW38_10790, partial [Terriglobia bacterium]|nr:hypothetical protein [Terriglobia bacterium]
MGIGLSKSAVLGMCFTITLFIPDTGLAAPDPFAGNWKLNLTKSRMDPDHHPVSATMRFDPTPNGYRLTVEGTHEAGDKVSNTVELNLDGRDHLVPGEFPEMLTSASRPKPNLIEIFAKKGGQIVSRNTLEVSKDGKKLSSTIYTKDGKRMSAK